MTPKNLAGEDEELHLHFAGCECTITTFESVGIEKVTKEGS